MHVLHRFLSVKIAVLLFAHQVKNTLKFGKSKIIIFVKVQITVLINKTRHLLAIVGSKTILLLQTH